MKSVAAIHSDAHGAPVGVHLGADGAVVDRRVRAAAPHLEVPLGVLGADHKGATVKSENTSVNSGHVSDNQ